jgi:hypothetical protein
LFPHDNIPLSAATQESIIGTDDAEGNNQQLLRRLKENEEKERVG